MESAHLAGVALAALLSENFLLVTCLGFNVPSAAFREPVPARRYGICVTLSMVTSVLLCWLCDYLVLRRFHLEYFRLMAFTLLSLASLALLRRGLSLFLPELSHRLGEYFQTLSANCASLGAALLASIRGYTLRQALIFALCGGLGVLLVLTSYAGLREDVNFESCPRCFRGYPIDLITAGLMALALVGFYGLHVS